MSIGDDLADVPVLRACGLAVAVADACAEARWVAHYTTQHAGGNGAVREAIELVLRCQGRWRGTWGVGTDRPFPGTEAEKG